MLYIYRQFILLTEEVFEVLVSLWFLDTFIDALNNSAPNPPVRRQTGENMKTSFRAPQDYDQLPPTSGTKHRIKSTKSLFARTEMSKSCFYFFVFIF